MTSLILFLSKLSHVAKSSEYTTDKSFTVWGQQTNEAPTKYAIERLRSGGEKLGRIIAFVTPTAKESAFDCYRTSITQYCGKLGVDCPEIKLVEIHDSISAAELFNKLVKEVFPVEPSDRLIIETTGGYRDAVNAFTLFSRFLQFVGVHTVFSTFADNITKTVSDTSEIDGVSRLLDAVHVFATTGNPKKMKDQLSSWKIPQKINFFKAAREFYYTILLCKTPDILTKIESLRDAIKEIKNAKYDTDNTQQIVFQELVLGIVERKMAFIYDKFKVTDFIQWCCDNWYLQQAVTFLKEGVIKNNSERYINKKEYDKLRVLRNSLNHAAGEAISQHEFEDMNEIMECVNTMLADPNNVIGFVKMLCAKIDRKTRWKELSTTPCNYDI